MSRATSVQIITVVAVLGVLLAGALSGGLAAASTAGDQWPDDYRDATEVGPGTHSGSIDSSDDTDYLKLAVQQGDTVTVTLQKAQGERVYAKLIWPGESTTLSDSGETQLTRKITVEDNGYVYVSVESYSDSGFPEDWSLSLDRTSGADEWLDDYRDAHDVNAGGYSGAVNSPDDTDYMKLAVQQGDTVTVDLSKAQGERVYAKVIWPGESTTLSDSGETQLTRKITAEDSGYVYVAVESYSVETTPEQWSLSFDRTSGEDEWRDDYRDANEIQTGTYSGTVNSPDDTDYVKLAVQQGDTIPITLEKAQGERVYAKVIWPGGSSTLYDRDETTLSERVTAEDNGYVYVAVESDSVETSPEQWSLNFDSEASADEWPDDYRDAESVNAGTISGSVDSGDDTDYVRVLVQQGDTVTVDLAKAQGERVYAKVIWPGGSATLYDSDETQLTRKVTAEDNGYVYVAVESDSDSGFPEDWSLSLDRTSGEDGWPDDYRDAPEVDESHYFGSVNSPDDTDYFRVMVQAGETYTVGLEKSAGERLFAKVIWPGGSATLYDSDARYLTKTVTADENGYIYVSVESDSVETTAEDWHVLVEEGAGSTTTEATTTVRTTTEITTTEFTTTEITTTETTTTEVWTTVPTTTETTARWTTTEDRSSRTTATPTRWTTEAPPERTTEEPGDVETTPFADTTYPETTASSDAAQPGFTAITGLVALVLGLGLGLRRRG